MRESFGSSLVCCSKLEPAFVHAVDHGVCYTTSWVFVGGVLWVLLPSHHLNFIPSSYFSQLIGFDDQLLRNALASWLSGFTGSSNGSCALSSRCWSSSICFLLAWELGFWYVVCKSDWLDAIRMLESPLIWLHTWESLRWRRLLKFLLVCGVSVFIMSCDRLMCTMTKLISLLTSNDNCCAGVI